MRSIRQQIIYIIIIHLIKFYIIHIPLTSNKRTSTLTICYIRIQSTRQSKLSNATNDTRKLQNTALKLFNSNYSFETMPPVRALTVSVSELCDENDSFQLDMFEDNELAERLDRLNHTVDVLKDRFGSDCVRQAFLLKDEKLTGFDPYEKNIIHPVSYFR